MTPGFVGVTDWDWVQFLASQPGIDEMNFWQPSGNNVFRALPSGGLFLFKLHMPRNFIVGGGYFAHKADEGGWGSGLHQRSARPDHRAFPPLLGPASCVDLTLLPSPRTDS